MKKIIITARILIMFLVLTSAFNALAQGSLSMSTPTLPAVTLDSAAPSSPLAKVPGRDSGPEPLTMLIFGTCIAGAATIERCFHKHK